MKGEELTGNVAHGGRRRERRVTCEQEGERRKLKKRFSSSGSDPENRGRTGRRGVMELS